MRHYAPNLTLQDLWSWYHPRKSTNSLHSNNLNAKTLIWRRLATTLIMFFGGVISVLR